MNLGLEVYDDLKMFELAKQAAIKRDNSRKIKEDNMKKLYDRMKILIVNDSDKIRNRITDELAKPKKIRRNKMVFYCDKIWKVDDYIKVFETCFDGELEEPLIDLLRHEFPHPYYKVYRKIVHEENVKTDELYKYYVIYIKWNKKKLNIK